MFVLFLVVCLKRCLVSSLITWGSSTIWIWLANTFHLDRNQHKVSHFGGSRCVKTESSRRRGRLFANVHGQRRSNIIDEEVFSEVRFVSINAILMAVLFGFPLNILLSHGTSKYTSASKLINKLFTSQLVILLMFWYLHLEYIKSSNEPKGYKPQLVLSCLMSAVKRSHDGCFGFILRKQEQT